MVNGNHFIMGRSRGNRGPIFGGIVVLCIGVFHIYVAYSNYRNIRQDTDILVHELNQHPTNLRIILLTMNQSDFLQTALTSICQAEFGWDRTEVEIWIDRKEDNTTDRDTFNKAMGFKCNSVLVSVHIQPIHRGKDFQYFNTWHPPYNLKEIVLFLPDNTVVSPHFYKWLKHVHLKYASNSNIYGFFLGNGYISRQLVYHPKYPSSLDGNRLHGMALQGAFSPKPGHWGAFLHWHHMKNLAKTNPGAMERGNANANARTLLKDPTERKRKKHGNNGHYLTEDKGMHRSTKEEKNVEITKNELDINGHYDTWEMELLEFAHKNEWYSVFPSIPEKALATKIAATNNYAVEKEVELLGDWEESYVR